MGYQNIIPLDEKANKNISDRYQKKTYTKGETCIYGNTLYKAKANIDTAEEWNPAHWEKTNLETIRAEMAAELSSLNASNAKTYVEITVPSEATFTIIAYPSGYSYTNSAVTSIVLEYPEYGKLSVTDTSTFYPVLRAGGFGFYNSNQEYYGKKVGLLLQKFS